MFVLSSLNLSSAESIRVAFATVLARATHFWWEDNSSGVLLRRECFRLMVDSAEVRKLWSAVSCGLERPMPPTLTGRESRDLSVVMRVWFHRRGRG